MATERTSRPGRGGGRRASHSCKLRQEVCTAALHAHASSSGSLHEHLPPHTRIPVYRQQGTRQLGSITDWVARSPMLTEWVESKCSDPCADSERTLPQPPEGGVSAPVRWPSGSGVLLAATLAPLPCRPCCHAHQPTPPTQERRGTAMAAALAAASSRAAPAHTHRHRGAWVPTPAHTPDVRNKPRRCPERK